MKTLFYATLLILFFSVPGRQAWQKDTQLKYNALADKFEYAAPQDRIKYNPIEDEWSYEAPNSQLRYNPMENKFEYAD